MVPVRKGEARRRRQTPYVAWLAGAVLAVLALLGHWWALWVLIGVGMAVVPAAYGRRRVRRVDHAEAERAAPRSEDGEGTPKDR